MTYPGGTCQYKACDREVWQSGLLDDPTTRWALCIGHWGQVKHAIANEAYWFEVRERIDSDGHLRIWVQEKTGWTLPGS
jgi:hypothetical protein